MQTVWLTSSYARSRAHELIDRAPAGCVVTVREAKRTTDQNAKLWAMLSDISRSKPAGRFLAPEVWKAALMSALGHEIIWQPGIDNAPPFPAGFRSSRLSKSQFADLITFAQEYGDRHGVRWTNEATE
ncbi:recombination protein NinB [Ketogulonicigenium vulgare]|uniref:recombination protein NinB n=1 Tax=Ketogulonicigenium vulgare TaxID=92945 RepID=UPI002359BAEF|nr:recombination protein NinB [Ketogulonicigenium vulgare]